MAFGKRSELEGTEEYTYLENYFKEEGGFLPEVPFRAFVNKGMSAGTLSMLANAAHLEEEEPHPAQKYKRRKAIYIEAKHPQRIDMSLAFDLPEDGYAEVLERAQILAGRKGDDVLGKVFSGVEVSFDKEDAPSRVYFKISREYNPHDKGLFGMKNPKEGAMKGIISSANAISEYMSTGNPPESKAKKLLTEMFASNRKYAEEALAHSHFTGGMHGRYGPGSP